MEPVSESNKEKKVALVTEAARGLGLLTARKLATKRFLVVLTARDMNAGEAAVAGIRTAVPNAQIECLELDTVQRFGLWHRLVDVLRALAILAGLTGYWLAFQTSTPTGATAPHVVFGRVFVLVSIVSMVFLLKPGLPSVYDLAWLRHFGGYLSRQPVRSRAGKYNAGQKVFISLSLLLATGLAATSSLLEHSKGSDAWHGGLRVAHGLLAVSTVVLVIGHLYLSPVAVPDTWWAMIHGRVSEEWLAYHHSDDDSIPSSSMRTEEDR